MHKTFLMSFSDKRDDRRTAVRRYSGTAVRRYGGTSVKRYKPTYIYPPLDKRYSPIISSICGPKNIRRKKNSDKYFIDTFFFA